MEADALDVATAWEELRDHPALTWTPPMWRVKDDDGRADTTHGRHLVRAVERNLTVDIVAMHAGQIEVRIATGPLDDRSLPNGMVDQTTPVARLDPFLSSAAPTFEEAVIRLRDAVRNRYGIADTKTTQ